MLTAKDIKYLRLIRGWQNACMTVANLEAEPYSWANEIILARWKQTLAFREYKLKSFARQQGIDLGF